MPNIPCTIYDMVMVKCECQLLVEAMNIKLEHNCSGELSAEAALIFIEVYL